jgi:hypothetical protein
MVETDFSFLIPLFYPRLQGKYVKRFITSLFNVLEGGTGTPFWTELPLPVLDRRKNTKSFGQNNPPPMLDRVLRGGGGGGSGFPGPSLLSL